MRKITSVFLFVLTLFLSSPAWALPTALTVQSVTEAAALLNLQAVDSANGNKFSNGQEDVLLVVQNTHASSSATVTITAQVTSVETQGFGTVTKSNQAVSLAALEVKVLGPFPRAVFNDSTEFVNFTISGAGATSVKAVPFKSAKLSRGI
jgi:hypothetical protein